VKTALLLMIHGSPYQESNAPVWTLIQKIRERGLFDDVRIGHLECGEPSIPEAIRQCVEAGAGRIIALPYFLHLGTHVVCDLPALLRESQTLFPQTQILVTPHLGASPMLTRILAQRAREALSAQ
jgi:sirohydrochlorin ferrochelatase